LRDRRTKLAQKENPLLRKPNARLQKKSLFVDRRTVLPRWRVRLQQSDRKARPLRPTALNQLTKLEPLRFLKGELSWTRANPLWALPAARGSALSIPHQGRTLRWKVGGASAGSKDVAGRYENVGRDAFLLDQPVQHRSRIKPAFGTRSRRIRVSSAGDIGYGEPRIKRRSFSRQQRKAPATLTDQSEIFQPL
jgi:hypothetical protein